MIPNTVTRSSIFSEFTEEEVKKYFSLTRAKVLPHIDNLYYNVFLRDDHGEYREGIKIMPGKMAEMLELLTQAKIKKKAAYENDVEIWGLDYYPSNFATFEHRLSCPECFDIFISSYIPNANTPRVHVQIRSRILVMRGAINAIMETLEKVSQILEIFDLEISSVQENRIDYAYHTNIIQDPEVYFKDDHLKKHLKTVFRKGQKVFYINDDLELSYFALGFRTSNNLFFRCYDKSREVCEKAYKGFFLERWRKHGLISEYDHFCYLEAYEKGSYTLGLLVGRIKWYLKYGKNDALKARLADKLRSCYIDNSNSDALRKELKGVLPEVTKICNCEFETKRKFYLSFADNLTQQISEDYGGPKVLQSLFNILANREPIHRYLTSKVVSFVVDRTDTHSDMLDFWQRIHSCKVGEIVDADVSRDYSSMPDMLRAKKEFLASTAKLASVYGATDSGTFEDDITDVLSNLNDNHFYGFKASPLGEIFELDPDGYYQVRRRKRKQARHLIDELRMQDEERKAQAEAVAKIHQEFEERQTAQEG